MRLRSLQSLLFATALSLSFAGEARAVTAVIDPVDFDRWMYPFNGTPGFRALGPVFGALGSPTFDNMDGQNVIAADTVAAGIPAGLGAAAYDVVSVRVTSTHFLGTFSYDPTYDSYRTYLDPSDPDYLPDTDASRPLQLFGVGFRNGYTTLSFGPASAGTPEFEEFEAFGATSGKGLRNVFALGFGTPDPEGDVSNHVVPDPLVLPTGFEVTPWAIGLSTSGLAPGDPVPEGVLGVSAGETFEFQVNLTDPDILAYVQAGLDAGTLAFSVVSLQETGMSGGLNPNLYMRDNFDPASIPSTIEVEVNLPECADGIDNDGDGNVDFPADIGCRDAAFVLEAPQCQDGLDNDGDGTIDFDGGASLNGGTPIAPADTRCADPFGNREMNGSCGLGPEMALLVPLFQLARARRRARRS